MFPRFLSSDSSDSNYALTSPETDNFDELYCGERICPAHSAPPGSSWWRAWAVILFLVATGWGWLQLPETLRAPVGEAVGSGLSALVAQSTRWQTEEVPPAPEDGSLQASLPPAAQEAQETASAPGADAGLEVVGEPASAAVTRDDSDNAASSQEATMSDEANAAAELERLPAPTVDPADREAARALAAGLHPDLSRVLLRNLTAADYENARKAIAAALAETPDDGTYVWPPTPGRKRAQFEVRFVAGAPRDCRRYVVTVIKNRWSTTARAMEKCGSDVRG